MAKYKKKAKKRGTVKFEEGIQRRKLPLSSKR